MRCLNILYYLNRDWQENWGGELRLWDPERKTFKAIIPEFNMAVLFKTTGRSYHGVEVIEGPKARRSLASYYLTELPDDAILQENMRRKAAFVVTPMDSLDPWLLRIRSLRCYRRLNEEENEPIDSDEHRALVLMKARLATLSLSHE